MTAAGEVAVGLLSGLVLGTLFFGGLWWTVEGLAESERPALRTGTSFVTRMALAAGGLVVMARLGALELLSALGGFLLARAAFTRWIGGTQGGPSPTDGPSERGARPWS